MTGLVRVWLVPADMPPSAAARCQAVLDDGERARAAAHQDPSDQQRFAVAHGALRILAGRELGVPPSVLCWTAGPHGKPALTSPWDGLHTSLSHSGGLVAVAVSTGRAVGVDVQELTPDLDLDRLSARFFPPDEARYVAAGPGSTRAGRFALLWVRKEAVVKAAGSRLWANLPTAVRDRDVVCLTEPPGPYRVADLPAPPGFRAAVALAGAAPFTLEAVGGPDQATALAMVG